MVYYELLKPGETITAVRYKQQLMNQVLEKKCPEYAKRHDKLILLHDSARPHVAESVNNILGSLTSPTGHSAS